MIAGLNHNGPTSGHWVVLLEAKLGAPSAMAWIWNPGEWQMGWQDWWLDEAQWVGCIFNYTISNCVGLQPTTVKKNSLKALGSCTALTFPNKPQLLMSIVKLAARVAVTTWHALGWSPAQKMLKALIYATCNSPSDMQWKSKMPNSLQPQSPITCRSPKVLITVESFEFVFAALAE